MFKKTIRIEELLYFAFLLFAMGAKGIGLTEGQKLFTICLLAAYCCMAAKLLITEYSVREWCMNVFLLILASLIRRSSGETAALAAVLLIIGMKEVPLHRAMKMALFTWGSTFVFSVIRGILGLGDGVVVVHEKLGLGPIIRYSLGYTHPNVLHVTYFVVVMLLLYVLPFKGKKLWAAAGILFLGNMYIFMYSVSYTGILIVTAYLCMTLYLDTRKRITTAEKILIECFAPFCIIFPIAGPLILKGNIFNFFNRILSTRFELVYYFFHNFRISLFGTKTITPSDAHLTLDSSFAYLLMYYGVIAFVLLVVVYIAVIHKFVNENRIREITIMVCTALAGITEQFLFNLSFKNIAFFCIGNYAYNYLSLKEKNNLWGRKLRIIKSEKLEKPFKINVCWENPGFYMLSKIEWKKSICISLAAAVLCVSIFLVTWDTPDKVYVNKSIADWKADYLTVGDNMEWDKDANLYVGSIDEGERVYELQGFIITVEKVRGMVSSFLWGGVVGLLVSVTFHRKRKKADIVMRFK